MHPDDYPQEGDFEGITFYISSTTDFWQEEQYPGFAEPLKPAYVYDCDVADSYTIGGYGAFLGFRNSLAKCFGSDEESENGCTEHPFQNFCDFPDCDGTIAGKVGCDIHAAFADNAAAYREWLDVSGLDDELREKFADMYDKCEQAFSVCKRGGCVFYC